jgi:hypothetical protein
MEAHDAKASTVRPPAVGSRWLHLGALLVALTVGVISLAFGIQALANGGPEAGVEAQP